MLYLVLFPFLLSLIFLLIGVNLAQRFGLVDSPDARKIHTGRVPLVGGLSIFLGGWIGVFFLTNSQPTEIFYLFLLSFFILVTGIYDDRYGLTPRIKLTFQFLISAFLIFKTVLWFNNFEISAFSESIFSDTYFLIFLTLFFYIGAINSLNMIDGVDGLAGGFALITIVMLMFVSYNSGMYDVSAILAIFSASIIPFLFCNLCVCGKKKQIYLGDSGSMFLGLFLTFFMIYLSQESSVEKSSLNFGFHTSLWFFAVPISDTLFVIIKRLINGESPFNADRNHLHHILLNKHGKGKTLLIIFSLTLVLDFFGLLLSYYHVSQLYNLIIFTLFLLVFLMFMSKFSNIDVH